MMLIPLPWHSSLTLHGAQWSLCNDSQRAGRICDSDCGSLAGCNSGSGESANRLCSLLQTSLLFTGAYCLPRPSEQPPDGISQETFCLRFPKWRFEVILEKIEIRLLHRLRDDALFLCKCFGNKWWQRKRNIGVNPETSLLGKSLISQHSCLRCKLRHRVVSLA